MFWTSVMSFGLTLLIRRSASDVRESGIRVKSSMNPATRRPASVSGISIALIFRL
jgi:hypothetical protein